MNKKMTMRRIKRALPQIALVSFLLILSILMILPLSWTISTSLRLPTESFRMPPSFFPTSFNLSGYQAIFEIFPFARFITNSLIVAASSVALNIVVTTMAAYSFSRINFPGRNVLFIVILSGMMLPAQATMIPLFIIMSRLGLVNTLWALILPASVSPLAIFLVRQFMLTVPKSYEEAAVIDGCGRGKIFLYLIIPMCKPVIMMTALLGFLRSWNDFLSPLIYIHDWNRMTLPVGLRVIQGYMSAGQLAEILAGVSLSLIVPIIMYVFGQRYLVEGLALSGLKS